MIIISNKEPWNSSTGSCFGNLSITFTQLFKLFVGYFSQHFNHSPLWLDLFIKSPILRYRVSISTIYSLLSYDYLDLSMCNPHCPNVTIDSFFTLFFVTDQSCSCAIHTSHWQSEKYLFSIANVSLLVVACALAVCLQFHSANWAQITQSESQESVWSKQVHFVLFHSSV